MAEYYTLQVLWGSTLKMETTELKDLCPGEKKFSLWANDLRERLYTTGFNLQTAPGTIEFINPFKIHTAYLIKQDKKYGI